MSSRLASILVVYIFALSPSLVACSARPLSTASSITPGATWTAVETSPSGNPVRRYGIFELTFKNSGTFENSFLDVDLQVLFTSPSGVQRRVNGFFYDENLWKVRFRPDEVGPWTFSYAVTVHGEFREAGTGTFESSPGDDRGPVRRSPDNPFRWIYADGTPYFPIGLQDCFSAHGDKLDPAFIDGEKRDDNKARQTSWGEYFSIYADAGFNLVRFSPNNCSYPLFDDLEHYRLAESKATDELLASARDRGFRVMFGFFGSYPNPGRADSRTSLIQRLLGGGASASDEAKFAREKRFAAYCVARWGVFVDFWELLNETDAPDAWTTGMAKYVRSVDPDQKPVSTSWERPYLSTIDINAPHWYESESEFQSDLRVQEQAAGWKKGGKPVIVGEQGNTGMNWDPLSGQRMRVRSWTALFQEIAFVFWNVGWSKYGMFQGVYTPGGDANIYLGPEERVFTRVLQDFSSRLDAQVRPVPIQVSAPDRVRGYGLVSNQVAAVYLHHFSDHSTVTRDLRIALDLPAPLRAAPALVGDWIDPATGNVMAGRHIAAGTTWLDVPPFTIDLALLLRQ